MDFYTSVNRHRNEILVRGVSNGNPVHKRVKFSPTLFIKSKEETGWTSINGGNLTPVSYPVMSEAKKAIDKFGALNVHGNTNYVAQYITSEWPEDISFNFEQINITSLDIEVMSDNGFPEPDKAQDEITLITVHNNLDRVFRVFGVGMYDKSLYPFDDVEIDYIECDDEVDLITKFLTYWNQPRNTPQILTGWNVKMFDVKYLVNRINNVLGENKGALMSPWGELRENVVRVFGKEDYSYELVGIQTLDYMDLFKKFGAQEYGTQESYKLDHICSVVLGEKKLSYGEYNTLHQLYENDYQTYVSYNIRDVHLIDLLEEETNMINLAVTLAYRAGVNFTVTLGTTEIWDSIIYRRLNQNKIAVPPKKENHSSDYPGGYVKDPVIGFHKWVVSFDLNSLYPNIIAQWNMSPEVVSRSRASGVSQEAILEGLTGFSEEGEAVSATGLKFRTDQDGIIPMIIREYYEERSQVKKRMIKAKKEHDKSVNVNVLHLKQMAIKILMNSLYGAYANTWFRYYDVRIAEAVTTTGQLSIKWAEKAINQKMNSVLKTENVDYVIAIDTDSLYVNMEPLVDKYQPKNPLEFLDQASKEIFEPELESSYLNLQKLTGSPTNRLEMSREVIADKAIWVKKKRYILRVLDNEGVRYDEPELKMMGIEAVKSSTPEICRNNFKKCFTLIMEGDESKLHDHISETKSKFSDLPVEEVAFPRGISELDKWVGSDMSAIKRTPIHVRGSIVFNKWRQENNMINRYEGIRSGDRIKFLYMKVPNYHHSDVISFPMEAPEELDLKSYCDYNKMFQKSFLKPLDPILDAVGWTAEPVHNLESIFG